MKNKKYISGHSDEQSDIKKSNTSILKVTVEHRNKRSEAACRLNMF